MVHGAGVIVPGEYGGRASRSSTATCPFVAAHRSASLSRARAPFFLLSVPADKHDTYPGVAGPWAAGLEVMIDLITDNLAPFSTTTLCCATMSAVCHYFDFMNRCGIPRVTLYRPRSRSAPWLDGPR